MHVSPPILTLPQSPTPGIYRRKSSKISQCYTQSFFKLEQVQRLLAAKNYPKLLASKGCAFASVVPPTSERLPFERCHVLHPALEVFIVQVEEFWRAYNFFNL